MIYALCSYLVILRVVGVDGVDAAGAEGAVEPRPVGAQGLGDRLEAEQAVPVALLSEACRANPLH